MIDQQPASRHKVVALRSTLTRKPHRLGKNARLGAPSAPYTGVSPFGGVRWLLFPDGGKQPPYVDRGLWYLIDNF